MRGLRLAALGGAIVIALALARCGSESVPLSGAIRIDGSPTLGPLTKAMAKRFMADHPDVRISVGTSGTNRGIARLCRGEMDAAGASFRIDEAAAAACRRSGAMWAEIPVVNDAVVLIVHPDVPVRCLTTRQLTQIWHRDSEVTHSWEQVDDLDPPYSGDLNAWGPGTDTEEFAFFNTVVNGRADSYRDYNNVLHRLGLTVQAVARDPSAFGYTEYGLYAPHAESVKAIAVDSGEGCVRPTPETIADGSFRPLSRTLFLYASARALTRPAAKAFLQYYLDNVEAVAPATGFVPLTEEQLSASKARLAR